MKRFASERHYTLAHAITDMAGRYGNSLHCAGLAFNSPNGQHDRKPWEQWDRSARRQFKALQRITRALRDLEASR